MKKFLLTFRILDQNVRAMIELYAYDSDQAVKIFNALFNNPNIDLWSIDTVEL